MIPVSGSVEGPGRDEVVHLATSSIRFSRILVGTDFSKPAARALKLAIAVGELFGSELFLVNAASPCVFGPGTYPASADSSV